MKEKIASGLFQKATQLPHPKTPKKIIDSRLSLIIDFLASPDSDSQEIGTLLAINTAVLTSNGFVYSNAELASRPRDGVYTPQISKQTPSDGLKDGRFPRARNPFEEDQAFGGEVKCCLAIAFEAY
jgi:hypothetical protein